MGGRGSSSSKANGRSTRTNQRSGPAALKGTDRQIEYATSIRNDVNQIFEDAKIWLTLTGLEFQQRNMKTQ